MAMLSSTLALFFVLFFAACACGQISVAVNGGFGAMTPLDPGDYEWYRYCGTDPGPGQPGMLWDCKSAKGVDLSSNALTSKAKGPACSCNYGYNSELTRPNNFPIQIRWGIPVCVDQPRDDSCKPGGFSYGKEQSGFGFRPSTNVVIQNPREQIFFGRVAHFNYVIAGWMARSWDFNLKLTLTIQGVKQESTFTYRLSLDETLNKCDKTRSVDGCNTNAYWNQNPTAMEWPSCVAVSDNSLDGAKYRDTYCCPYRTINVPCSDKVNTLSQISQESAPFIINGLEYTVFLGGFSVPGTTPPLVRTYFISQERQRTEAELWGYLILKCPVGSCPDGTNPVVNAAGTSCDCICPPSQTGPCANPVQKRNTSTCACVCDSTKFSCGAGTLVQNGNECSCSCAALTCPAGLVVSGGGSEPCACVCPAGICGPGSVADPKTCACTCASVACPLPNSVADPLDKCACKCGLTGAQCTAAGAGCELIADDCECGNCANPCISECTRQGECYASVCDLESNTCDVTLQTGACGSGNLCIERCVPAGDGQSAECQAQAVECPASALVDKYGAANATCYTNLCAPATGECEETFTEGPCTALDLHALYGSSAQCFSAQCVDGGCVAVFAAGAPCELDAGDAALDGLEVQCYAAQCDPTVQRCAVVPQVDKWCSDNNGCTSYPNTTNPFDGSAADRCIAAAANESLQCVGYYTPCVVPQDAECQNYTCFNGATGAFCVPMCVVASKNKASKVGVIIGSTAGAAFAFLLLLLLAVVLFKILHDKGLLLGRHAENGFNAASDNPLFSQTTDNTSPIYG